MKFDQRPTVKADPSHQGSRAAKMSVHSNMSGSKLGTFVKKGTMIEKSKKIDPIAAREKQIKDQIEEKILKQIDKTFVLCIDPESRLPFMVNMGLKTADICDLDDRALKEGGATLQQQFSSGVDSEALMNSVEDVNDENAEFHQRYDILKCKNYPFYHKITRSLYIMGQLLNDDNKLEQSPKNQLNHNTSVKYSAITKWAFENNPNVEAFRRCMLPFYLLKDDSGWQHPRYIEQSNLSQNLCEKTSVSITIYLNKDIQEGIEKAQDYITQDLRNMAGGKTGGIQRRKTLKKQQIPPIKIENFYLLKTAQALIEEVMEKMQQEHLSGASKEGQKKGIYAGGQTTQLNAATQQKVSSLWNQNFSQVNVLKFKNLEAYVYGETQLIYFSDVREHIKSEKEIELVLMNVQGEQPRNIKANLDYTGIEGSIYSRRQTVDPFEHRGTMSRNSRITSKMMQAVNQSPLSIDQQMQMFPPMVNTLYMEKEIEYFNQSKRSKYQQQLGQGSSDQALDIELQMKTNLAQVYNTSSTFFWFPPKGLLTARTIEQREQRLRDSLFPGNGFSYTVSSTENLQQERRMKVFTKKYSEANKVKASWRSLRSDSNKYDYLRSGSLQQDLTIKIKSVGNLIQMIADLHAGNNTILDIYEYHYTDTSYESQYGYDCDLQGSEAQDKKLYKEFKKQLKERENQEKISDRELIEFLGKCSDNYEKESRLLLSSDEYTDRMQMNGKVLDFMNFSSNSTALQNTFKNQKFHVIKAGKEKKKAGHGKKEKTPSTTSIVPTHIQVEAALYLGCERISQYSYSKPKVFAQGVDFADDELTFYSLSDQNNEPEYAAQKFQEKPKLKISNLPSNTRVVFQLILIPETFSMMLTQRSLPKREGYIYGSVAMPLYDIHRRLKQGTVRLLAWPLKRFDERFICMADYYRVKHQKEIKNNFNSNLDIVIDLPRYHTDVYWDIGLGLPFESRYAASQEAQGSIVDRSEFHRKTRDQLSQRENALSQRAGGPDEEFPLALGLDRIEDGIEDETKKIQTIKKIIQQFPLERDLPEYDRRLIQNYRHFVLNIAMYIRAIDFTNPREVALCYDFLENSEQSKHTLAEDALALLDAEFGDERIRLFAVTKLSQLNDTYLSLYIPQLVQALKYEIHHKSALGELLLERSLQNPRVVGHAFFWSLRAGIHEFRSYERFYLILERFLMCCGRYKYELFRQNAINKALIEVHKTVQQHIEEKKEQKKKKKKEKRKDDDQPLDAKKQIENKLYEALKMHEFLTKLRQALVLEVNQKNISLRNQVSDQAQGQQVPKKSISGFQPDSFQGLGDKRRATSTQYQFGNHYIGHPFDIDAIEKCITEQQTAYNRASPADQDKGLIVTLTDGNTERPIQWQKESIILPFLPKKFIKSFTKKSGVFMSKQVPLFLQAEVRPYEEDTEADALPGAEGAATKAQSEIIKLLFKYGDDLRQDNLVLQFFRIMDEMWMEKNMNMEMVVYKVLETGFEVGYIEFVDNSDVISTIHKWRGFMKGPFEERCMYEYFKQKVYPEIFKSHLHEIECKNKNDEKKAAKKEDDTVLQAMLQTDIQLERMHQAYIMSTAGQCVATYTLGIRDRHSGNFMFNKVSGKFFHIDFGHFLNHCKKKFGILRDREPFILSREMFYLMTNWQRLYKDFKKDESSTFEKHLPKAITNQVNGLDSKGNKVEQVQAMDMRSSFVADNKLTTFDEENKKDLEKAKEKIQLSQRKLVRVYKWKEDLYKTYQKTDVNGRNQIMDENVYVEANQDYILVTDQENFIQKPLEFIHGIHHLQNIKSKNSVYNTETLSRLKHDLQSTSADQDVATDDELKFKRQCGKAFQILRDRAYVFINLLQLMLVSDIEELQQKDIRYLIRAMFLDMGEEQAQSKFQDLIKDALNEWYRKYDNWFHNYMDKKKGQK